MKKALVFLLLLSFVSCGRNGDEDSFVSEESLGEGVRSIEVSESADVLALSEDTEIDGYVFLAGSTIAFTPEGEIRFGVLAEGAMLDGKWYDAGSFVEFFPDGEDE